MAPVARPLALLAGLALSGACSCSEEPPASGELLELLARRPDATIELPGAIVPRGDVPGKVTFGASEGPGWSETDHKLADGTHYRETNQASASLVLPATRPEEREIVMALWCARPADAEPARVRVRLNGLELAKDGLSVGRGPALLRVHAPAPAWLRGDNRLELSVPLVERDHGRSWDTLALASVAYGAEARVTLDVENGSARLVDGTGVRYALELASEAMLELEGTAAGAGELSVRTGTLDPRTGGVELEEGEPLVLAPRPAGALAGRVPLTLRPGLARVVELEWSSSSGSELALRRLEARERASPPRPPIVFVSIDTLAARHLGLHGYARATSPELEKLARDAVVFERCYANAPWTLPSYLSVMSGLFPRAHWLDLVGAEVTPFDRWQLAASRWTVAEALRARGYRTGGFVDTYWLSPIFRFEQGFDVYDGEGALAPLTDPGAHVRRIVEELVPAWLERGRPAAGGPPPFLFLHALDAHGPYLPDAPFRDAFARDLPEERTLVAAGSNNETYRTMPDWMGRTHEPDERKGLPPELPLEDTIARYDETILKVDHFLGRLFAELRERGLYDEAVIAVSGDHGEHFGPDAYGHGVMHEDVLHVPLVLKLPGNAHAGKRVEEGVQLVDLYPTLLELAGADAAGRALHGESLLPRIERAAAGEPRALFSEGGHVEQYALTQGCWRLVEERPGSEASESSLLTHPRVSDEWYRANVPELPARPLTKQLLDELKAQPGFEARLAALRAELAGPYYALFDVCRDPEQRDDRAAAEPERLARMKTLLEAEKQRARSAQAEADPFLVRPTLSPDARRELEKLGYGGGEDPEPDSGEARPPDD
jgi:arylsulfatase